VSVGVIGGEYATDGQVEVVDVDGVEVMREMSRRGK
jgi:hypothetical protein